MRYFVIAPDGQKYGPADEEILNEWIAEGRLSRDTLLEREDDRERVLAQGLSGLSWDGSGRVAAPPVVAVETPPPGYVAPPHPYLARPASVESGHPGHEEWILAVAFAAASFFCPFVNLIMAAVAVIYATKAKAQGHPGGHTALIMAYVAAAYTVISTVMSLVALSGGMPTGF